MPTPDVKELLKRSAQRAREAGEGGKGPAKVHVYERPNSRAIRERLGLSQSKFATMLGISKRTLEGWEQGRRVPAGPARRLLDVAQRFPLAVYRTAFERTERTEVNACGAVVAVSIAPARGAAPNGECIVRVETPSCSFTSDEPSNLVSIPAVSSSKVTEHGEAYIEAHFEDRH